MKSREKLIGDLAQAKVDYLCVTQQIAALEIQQKRLIVTVGGLDEAINACQDAGEEDRRQEILEIIRAHAKQVEHFSVTQIQRIAQTGLGFSVKASYVRRCIYSLIAGGELARTTDGEANYRLAPVEETERVQLPDDNARIDQCILQHAAGVESFVNSDLVSPLIALTGSWFSARRARVHVNLLIRAGKLNRVASAKDGGARYAVAPAPAPTEPVVYADDQLVALIMQHVQTVESFEAEELVEPATALLQTAVAVPTLRRIVNKLLNTGKLKRLTQATNSIRQRYGLPDKKMIAPGQSGRPKIKYSCDHFPGETFYIEDAAIRAGVSITSMRTAITRNTGVGKQKLLFYRPTELVIPADNSGSKLSRAQAVHAVIASRVARGTSFTAGSLLAEVLALTADKVLVQDIYGVARRLAAKGTLKIVDEGDHNTPTTFGPKETQNPAPIVRRLPDRPRREVRAQEPRAEALDDGRRVINWVFIKEEIMEVARNGPFYADEVIEAASGRLAMAITPEHIKIAATQLTEEGYLRVVHSRPGFTSWAAEAVFRQSAVSKAVPTFGTEARLKELEALAAAGLPLNENPNERPEQNPVNA